MGLPAKPTSISLKPNPPIPKAALAACKKLTDQNFIAWFAGGCVRDFILGRTPRDWDIVTNAPLAEIQKLFPNHIDVGVKFGIVKLVPEAQQAGSTKPVVDIDIAIFRHEEGYSDSRHPDTVTPGDEKTDVARRDFTCNALYFDPKTSMVIDYVEGLGDVRKKLIKTVGNPNTRFSEDALRILRAIRFSTQLGFKIDPTTIAALKKNRHLLKKISRERVREEMVRLFESPSTQFVVSRGLETICRTGIWEIIFGNKRTSIPADLRQFKAAWKMSFIHWLIGLSISGLLGDPIKGADEIVTRLTPLLKLSNEEKKILFRVLHIFEDATRKNFSQKCSPADWIELAKQNPKILDVMKAFVRRARGPSTAQKEQAVKLILRCYYWAKQTNYAKNWPNAEALMKQGKKAGPELGQELKNQQWMAFWG